jgi:hypothetical protein
MLKDGSMAMLYQEGEYGPYEMQDDGLPHYGQVVLDFIKRNNWTVEQFGEFYGKAIRGKAYTKMRIYQMVQDNTFPMDGTRRFIIATLLHIPAILLGVDTVDDLLTQEDSHERREEIPEKTSLDVMEYETFLQDCWKQNRAVTAQHLASELLTRIHRLHATVLYVNNQQQKRMFHLLCEYHTLLGKIEGDQQHYEQAVIYLTRAALLAREQQFPLLYAVARLQRGIILREQGSISQGAMARQAMHTATNDFTAALKLDHTIDAPLRASLLMAKSDVQAYSSYQERNVKEMWQALLRGDEAYNISSMESEIHFVRFNKERFHLAKASTLIDIGASCDALEHLDLLIGNTPAGKRRYAYLNVLLAQAYLKQQRFPIATEYATEALALSQEIHSNINITRITRVYEDLQKSSYGNSREVTELGIALLHTRYPYLFHGGKA